MSILPFGLHFNLYDVLMGQVNTQTYGVEIATRERAECEEAETNIKLEGEEYVLNENDVHMKEWRFREDDTYIPEEYWLEVYKCLQDIYISDDKEEVENN